MPDAASDTDRWQLICLCAAWCGVCRDWQPVFDTLAAGHPGWQVAWVDVEDQDEAMGDVDIETFPTLLIAQGRTARFLGPVQPSAQQLTRLLAGLQSGDPGAPPADDRAQALLERLCASLPDIAGA